MQHYLKRRVILAALLSCIVFQSGYSGDNPRTVVAVRVNNPPTVDGYLNENIWKQAEPATDFIQRDPTEGQLASEKTEIRVLYDNEALYFGCRFYDSEPDKIVARLTRRDDEIESDWGSIYIDSYNDNQTGFEFTFNPAGVKVDIIRYNDGESEDDSWDPVWYFETVITSEGWSAEVKIPFRVLRYRTESHDSVETTWGINFIRTISRKQESSYWAFTPKSQEGFISRFGRIAGLKNLPRPRIMELLPFIVAKQNYNPPSEAFVKTSQFSYNAGIDFKYSLSSNFTLDATINPDFGQVEADPAVLNLTTYETFYPEKRPFFIEGTQILHFTTFGGEFGPGMFYSRRIGRALSRDEIDIPEGRHVDEFPQNVTILGAAKITGKTHSGLSVGVLEAFTEREEVELIDNSGGKSTATVAPFAHYNVIRLKQDVLKNSNVGMIFTSVLQHTRNPAFANGYDWDVKFSDNMYRLDGFLAFTHNTNRAGDRRTGSAGKISFGKNAGEHWLWSLSTDFTSKRYNVNDLGFFMRPNDYGANASCTYKEDVPAKLLRNYRIELGVHERDNFDGANIGRSIQLESSGLFSNYWGAEIAGSCDIGRYDDRETRGLGLYQKPSSYRLGAAVETDERENIIVSLDQSFGFDVKEKRSYNTEIGIEVKPFTWMNWKCEYAYQRTERQESWVTNLDNYSIFGDRNTITHDMIIRSTVTFTRELTLQVYGQLFLAKGHYDGFRQLIGTSEFIPVIFAENKDFNDGSFALNVVLRWEYITGSTLYLVWSQARSNGESRNYYTNFGEDLRGAFDIAPANGIELKVNYWFSI